MRCATSRGCATPCPRGSAPHRWVVCCVNLVLNGCIWDGGRRWHREPEPELEAQGQHAAFLVVGPNLCQGQHQKDQPEKSPSQSLCLKRQGLKLLTKTQTARGQWSSSQKPSGRSCLELKVTTKLMLHCTNQIHLYSAPFFTQKSLTTHRKKALAQIHWLSCHAPVYFCFGCRDPSTGSTAN